jgi:hypothetical protein
VGDGCNAASTETYGSEDECGCALRYTSTKASRRWIVHASGAKATEGVDPELLTDEQEIDASLEDEPGGADGDDDIEE